MIMGNIIRLLAKMIGMTPAWLTPRGWAQIPPHNKEGDPVPDAKLANLLAEPHQEYGAGGHRQHGDNLPTHEHPAVRILETRQHGALGNDERPQVAIALEQTEN